MAKDIEQAIEDVKGKKFGVSINNIIAIVTFLSTAIAGWYSFTGRIDSLEEVVQGFAEASDIEIVQNNFNNIDEELKYLREKVDGLKTPKVKSYDGDIIKLQNEIDKLKGEISRLEKLLKDPLADFTQEITMSKFWKLLVAVFLFSVGVQFMGCAASVSTEQYVGEYEKQKS